jgi:ABC-2 type transport system ATP-binding protein
MIEVRSLTKNYGARKAIENLNFSVKKGEVVGFLGPNGAGKTTTMKIITGFMAASSGSVQVAGFDVFESPIEVKKRIGYLPETPPVYGDMRVNEYLRFVAELKGVEKSRISSLVDRAIEKTDLGSVSKRLIQNLSKGYRQRVGISQALVSDPEVLILDEPTVGLDPRQVAEIRSVIKELAGQHTIILSTHILPEVQASCERIIIINQGHIVAQDTIAGISTRTMNSTKVHLRVLRPSDELLMNLQSLSGVRSAQKSVAGHYEIETNSSESIPQEIAALVIQKNSGLLEIRSETSNLEDVFLKLTSSEETQGAQL